MKISAIQQKFYYLKTTPKQYSEKCGGTKNSDENLCLPPLYYPTTTFMGMANSGKLKLLFSYGLPCMYSGIEMIDPKKVQKLLRLNAFNNNISEVLKKTEPFEKSLLGIEKDVYNILKEQAKKNPDITVQDTLKNLAPYYNSLLRKMQAPIFHKLIVLAKGLPEEERYRFRQLMQETRDKLANRPILMPFSTSEFKYKLSKIKDDIENSNNIKAKKVLRKLTQEANKLPEKNSKKRSKKQQEIVNFMQIVLNTSILKEHEALQNLLDNAKRRLNGEKIETPFNRKSFIYDLAKLLEEIPDIELKDDMLKIASHLPTSRECISAYVMKFAPESSEKIIYRLLWPSMASVEHIFPRSCGGIDDLSNYGGACTRENSDRKSISFLEQLKRKPKTKIFCQRYVDRLIELVHQGIFAKHNIDTKYIEEFRNTILEESKGQVLLDISKLYYQ